MKYRIFISYNANDKNLVEPVFIYLKNKFGEGNIFIDAWSINPGDSLIGKMNIGLETMTHFIFFISKNSLKSGMVQKEWHTALYMNINKKCEFIPVIIDSCIIPAILLDICYINAFKDGYDAMLQKLVSRIENKNNYIPEFPVFNNLEVTCFKKTDCEYEITISAIKLQESKSIYAISFDNDLESITCYPNNQLCYTTKYKDVLFNDGKRHNVIVLELMTPTIPGFPIKIHLSTNNNSKLKFNTISKAINENQFDCIDLKFI